MASLFLLQRPLDTIEVNKRATSKPPKAVYKSPVYLSVAMNSLETTVSVLENILNTWSRKSH